jgi:methanogenic corrinoid protein MtbC1
METIPSVKVRPKPWPLFKLVSPLRPARPVAGLQEMVEGEIIPRLVRAHPNGVEAADCIGDAEIPLDHQSALAFLQIILSKNSNNIVGFVENQQARGIGAERLFTDLLAPAALGLSELWEEDKISFTEVTIGLGRLQHVVRGLASDTAYNGDSDPSASSCLFSPRPGEQQTFGFYMIEELFRWSGWRTWIETAATDADMVADVRSQWFDVFCLSVSRSTDIEDVAKTIEAVRRASCNQRLFVLVNGRPFGERPELVAAVGADAAASCGREALHIADKAVWRLATA